MTDDTDDSNEFCDDASPPNDNTTTNTYVSQQNSASCNDVMLDIKENYVETKAVVDGNICPIEGHSYVMFNSALSSTDSIETESTTV